MQADRYTDILIAILCIPVNVKTCILRY